MNKASTIISRTEIENIFLGGEKKGTRDYIIFTVIIYLQYIIKYYINFIIKY